MIFRNFAAGWRYAVANSPEKGAFFPETGQFLHIRKHSKQPILWAALLCVYVRQAGRRESMVGSPLIMPFPQQFFRNTILLR